MLPRDLKRIVDEYVGTGFTQCKLAKIDQYVVGSIGGNKIMVMNKGNYEILDYETQEVM